MRGICFVYLLLATALLPGGEPGSVDRPEKVGRFGNPHAILIEGAESFEPDEIRDALVHSSSFVLGSHPSAPFDEFLGIIEGCLVRGYKAYGFSTPAVEVEWDAGDDTVVARIEEGPRFKMGGVRIVGAKAVREEKIRWWLIDEEREGRQVDFDEPGEKAFKRLAKEKELPAEIAQLMLGAGAPVEGNVAVLGGANTDLSWDDPAAPWSAGSWVNFTVSARMMIQTVVARAYMEEGYQFAEFKVGYEEGKRNGTKDLVVTVLDESPLSLLGEVVVAGNAINTDAAILRFLGLEKGMELKGPYEVELRRRLWESGRFLGWHIVSWRPPDEAVVNLSICVAEHWEAPPLEAPLTRERKALMRFAKWFNAYDGRDGDLMITAEERREGWGKLELALDQDGGVLVKVEAQGLGVFVESSSGNYFRTLLWGVAGKYHASVSGGEMNAIAYLDSMEQFLPADLSPGESGGNVGASRFTKGSVSMGMGITSILDRSTTRLGFDPTLVFRMTSCLADIDEFGFEQGVATVRDGDVVLCFEEESGRLISVDADVDEAVGLARLTLEPGGVARLQREFEQAAAGVPNAMDGQSGWTMVAGFAGLLKEIVDEGESLEKFEGPAELHAEIGARVRRARKWLPVAETLGELAADFLGDDEELDDEKVAFEIPIDPELMMGMNWMAMITAAFYGEMAESVEPGSWPDLVLREVLFHVHGKTEYLDETVETLFRDEAMGPLGCLVCAELLEGAGHHGARRFVEKARTELSAEGFAKDWVLILRGKPGDDGAGWQTLRRLGEFRAEDLDLLFPDLSPRFRIALGSLLDAGRAAGDDASGNALAPVMNSLWEEGFGDMVAAGVESAAAEHMPKVNPARIGVVVNGTPIPRSAVHINEWLGRPHLDGEFEDDWITQVLFAQQIWKEGSGVPPAKVAEARKAFVEALGEGDATEGWKKVKAAGMNEKQLEWLLGTFMTASAYGNAFVSKEEITDAEVRAFYDERPDLFGGALKTHVHRIMIPKEGEGLDPAEQLKLADRILARLQLVDDPDELQKAFREEAMAHSVGAAAEEGGCLLWIVPEDWFDEKLAKAIALVPDMGLSKVIDDGRFLHIIHVPMKRRMEGRKKFDEVAEEARRRALRDRAAKRLRGTADIVRIDPPADGEVYEDPEPDEAPGGVAEKVKGLLGKAAKSGGGAGKKNAITGVRGELDLVQKKAGEGDALSLFYLGTYHERGVGMPRDLEAARKLYEQAAAAGERKAMLRLADHYFTGQGVGRDEKKAREWREAAAMDAAAGP